MGDGGLNNRAFDAWLAKSKKSESHDANRRPNTGEPGSTWEAPNGDWRTFGPNKKPLLDYDHNDHDRPDIHPHDENGRHYHDWDWTKDPPRQPPHAFSWDPLLGAALVTVCVLGIIVVAADNLTGIGVADDFLFGPLGAGVSAGASFIFG